MAFNLLRNTKAFFTLNVDANTGVVADGGFDNTNTFEIQVLDGLSFSQNTTAETITINEAGSAPVRGQRMFNSALDPVEFSFSTYVRPDKPTTNVICEEQVLWNALAAGYKSDGTDAIGETGAAWTAGATSVLSFEKSQAHQMQRFGMLFFMDGAAFVIDNCALDQATIDFGLDALATIAWTGRGTTLRQIQNGAITTAGVISGTGLATAANTAVQLKSTAANYIANKLSTLSLYAGISGSTTSYNVPITGGSITFANNITYLTPANLGVINTPVTYFTGTRAISGSVTAYLRNNTVAGNDTGDLMAALLTSASTDVSPAFNISFAIGGSSNATKVVIAMPAAMLQIPSISTEQVVTTTINFTAQGYTGNAYDLEKAQEATVTYHSA